MAAEAMPFIAPMLATASRELPPVPSDWAAEIKWDGMRASAYLGGGRLLLRSRAGRDITGTFPELNALSQAAGTRSMVLDGEIVVFDADGRASFALLQRRMHIHRPSPWLAAAVPVTFVAFDLLEIAGRSLLRNWYEQRRAMLEHLDLQARCVQVPPAFPGDAAVVAEIAARLGHEGIVLKRLGSHYLPGRRAASWVKYKQVRVTDVTIGGWVPGQGYRSALAGSLLAGVPDERGLAFIGLVGSGLTIAELLELTPRLRSLEQPGSPFTGHVPSGVASQARWVRPVLTAEVAYAELTPAGRLRQPVWRGLRPQ